MSKKRGMRQLAAGTLLFAGLLPEVLLSTAIQGRAQGPPASSALEDALDRAHVAQNADRYAEAAAAYAEATAIDPAIPELWANRGLMEHFAGDPAHAIDSFKHALAARPSLYTAILFTGIDYVSLNESERGLPYLKRALALKPANPDTHEALGKAYMALHEPAQAASNYQAAVLRSPQSSAAWYGLGVASLALIDQSGGALARRHAKTPWSLALYADEMLVQGRPLESIDAYKQAAAGSTIRERETFAAVLTRSSIPSQGSVEPAVPAASLDQVMAVLQTTQDHHLAPCPVSTRAERQNTHGSSDRGGQTMACSYLQHDASAAAAAAAKQLALTPDDPEALYWSVKANERRAVEALSQFEHFAPHSAATYDLVGDLYRRRMQPDNALEQYSKALAIDSHDVPALLGSAAAYLSVGDMERSMAAAEIALTASPSSPRLNLLMAESLVNLHRYPEAGKYLKTCLAAIQEANADPVAAELAPRAHALLGRVEAGLNNVPDAITEMNLGLASDQDGSLHFQLSRLYRQVGKAAEAKIAEAEAVELMAQRRAHAVIAVRSSTESQP